MPLHGDNKFCGEDWSSWNGHLTKGIDGIIHNFLTTLLQHESILDTLLINQRGVNSGGLGILYPSQQAAPDFVLKKGSETLLPP